jgi:ribosome biogenesis GTPase
VAKSRKQKQSAAVPPPGTPANDSSQTGLVLAHYGRTSLVETAGGEPLRCATRKNLPRTVCGDRVHWQATNPREGVVTAVLKRETTLSRPDPSGRSRPVAANIDQIIVVIACRPSFEHGMLDRYLAAAELTGASPVIVVNKSDLLDAASRTKLQQRLAVYPAIGYSLVFTSTRSTDGLKDLHRHLAGHTSILVGQSGVGKSSLVQALLPDLDIRTGSLSEATGLGRHTTTVAMLYHVPGGGDLIDSPGVRDFALDKVAPDLLEKGFPEFAAYLGQCRFHNCRHVSEPGCAVHNAARDGAISALRLENYRELVKAMA